jgi:hypothetical protein
VRAGQNWGKNHRQPRKTWQPPDCCGFWLPGEPQQLAEPKGGVQAAAVSRRATAVTPSPTFRTVASRLALNSLMQLAVISASCASPPNSAFDRSSWRRSASIAHLVYHQMRVAARSRACATGQGMYAAPADHRTYRFNSVCAEFRRAMD